jgi:hypothetical protein
MEALYLSPYGREVFSPRVWTSIAWDLPPGATAQAAGEKLGLGHLL